MRVEKQPGGPGFGRRPFGPGQHLQEERIAEVADDQAVGGGAAAAQRLGLRVGAVAELGGGGQDPAAGVVRHAGLPVQREAHRGHRDAGQTGHVPDPRRLPPSALLTRHGLAYGYDALLPPIGAEVRR